MAVVEPGKNKIIPEKEKKLTKEEREELKISTLQGPRNFENFIDAYLKYTEEQESTTKIHKWVAVSMIAAALERRVFLDAGHFTVFPNFYIFIIGNSGEVRKSTSTGIGYSLIDDSGIVRLMSERLTDRSLINQMKRSKTEFYHDFERKKFSRQSAVYAYASELVIFLKEVKGSISELLTTLWDCPKKWTYETHGDGEIELDGVCLNILGASTPTWLQRSIPAEEMEGGLASRIVFVVEMNPPERYNAWGVPKEARPLIDEMKPKLIEDLRRFCLIQGTFTYTDDAKNFYESWYKKHRKNTKNITDIRFKGYYSRKPVTVWKLAMILSIAESDELIFSSKHVKTALDWLDEIEDSMLEAFGVIGDNPLAKGMKTVFDSVKNQKDGVNAADVYRTMYTSYNKKEFEQIIHEMQYLKTIDIKVVGPHLILFPGSKKL